MLGGHSFVQQLGNDPIPDPGAAVEVVAACLDAGIRWFDTTFRPERIALGAALARLGRRDEATIACWSHFRIFGPEDEYEYPIPLEPHHLEVMTEDLQTDRIDAVVVSPVATRDCPEKQEEQEAVAARWKADGRVRLLGAYRPGADADQRFGPDNPYDFQVQPHHVEEDATEVFRACRRLGWMNIACTPFGRGWTLDRIVEKEGRAGDGGFRAHVADLMLRYSLYSLEVDRLIVAMRRPEWVEPNVESARRGPLSDEERTWLRARASEGGTGPGAG
jgi:aryl-alcohol dehydrogenase-like predicted oxidoreductase